MLAISPTCNSSKVRFSIRSTAILLERNSQATRQALRRDTAFRFRDLLVRRFDTRDSSSATRRFKSSTSSAPLPFLPGLRMARVLSPASEATRCTAGTDWGENGAGMNSKGPIGGTATARKAFWYTSRAAFMYFTVVAWVALPYAATISRNPARHDGTP